MIVFGVKTPTPIFFFHVPDVKSPSRSNLLQILKIHALLMTYFTIYIYVLKKKKCCIGTALLPFTTICKYLFQASTFQLSALTSCDIFLQQHTHITTHTHTQKTTTTKSNKKINIYIYIKKKIELIARIKVSVVVDDT